MIIICSFENEIKDPETEEIKAIPSSNAAEPEYFTAESPLVF